MQKEKIKNLQMEPSYYEKTTDFGVLDGLTKF